MGCCRIRKIWQYLPRSSWLRGPCGVYDKGIKLVRQYQVIGQENYRAYAKDLRYNQRIGVSTGLSHSSTPHEEYSNSPSASGRDPLRLYFSAFERRSHRVSEGSDLFGVRVSTTHSIK
ncbi:hypothetical protein TWF217_001272 [Orbilia oligospora]|nr:hypothetical protein TWF217_001272 [Orbilia oligospora]KAF3243936.1 hypothetical protein TWF128_009873 [Orbilia oligospora]